MPLDVDYGRKRPQFLFDRLIRFQQDLRDVAPDDPTVRPLAYVEDYPVIRRIGERDLYLGNVHAADPDQHDRSFEFVLSLTSEPQPATTHHNPLVDGVDAEWQRFERAVDTARSLYRRDEPLLVHCRGGISRSTAVLAATLAAEEHYSLREALSSVQRHRPVAMPNPPLHLLAVVYLAARA